MILMNNFTEEPQALKAAMLNAISRVIDSGYYILGEEVKRFEQAWATRCHCSHGIGVGNGMDAIEIGLRALDVGPGDEVITTSMTAFATVLAIIRCGATPVLADIRADTAHLDMDSVERCLSPKTKAVLLVHLYGQIADMTAWQAFCSKHEIALLEDCAQAHLAEWDGQAAGSFGSFGAYSFYPTKNLGTIGDAGIIVSNDAALAEKAASLRNYGQSVRYHHPKLGLNSRLDELHAAILSERLVWLDEFTERRRVVATAYRQGIRHAEVRLLPPEKSSRAHVYHLFVVTSSQRDALQAHLARHGIQSHIHYPIPVHQQDPCMNLRRDPHGLPVTEAHAATCLSLPCHPFLSDGDITAVIDAVNSFSRMSE